MHPKSGAAHLSGMTKLLIPLVAAGVCSLAAAAEEPPPGACHAGAYAMSDGSRLVITPSDPPALRYRSLRGTTGKLFPLAGHSYESGDGWAVQTPVTVEVEFEGCREGQILFRRSSITLSGERIDLPTRPIRFHRDEIAFYGELILPRGREPAAVLVLQYGGGRDSAVYYNFLQHLLPLEDIAVFVFDKRGTGRSTGHFSAHIGMLADDLVAAVEAVRSVQDLRGVPLGLMGESQGGWVAPLAAAQTPVDFVVVSYGLAVSMLEEDRLEMRQSLQMQGYGPDVLAKGEKLHRAAARVMVSRFTEGREALERLKAEWRDQEWFAHVGGDFTSVLAATPTERMPEIRALFDFPYDLAYEPLPVLRRVDVPQLWVLAGRDTEAPHASTLVNLRELQAAGLPIEIAVFPTAEHGMIAVEEDDGRHLAGYYADGYFDLLIEWISSRGEG
jgi:uncharacterized protein